MNLVEELRDDFLMCTICFEEFREPKQLPCLHTFCRQCLAKYIVGKVVETGADNFPCPFCRKAIQPAQAGEVKSWADTFPTNFVLCQLSSRLKEKAASLDHTSGGLSPRPQREGRAMCSEHSHYPLVGYCTRQRKGVCEECCVQRHSDCIRSHVRERESRLLAEERRSECRECMGALLIKVESLRDRITTQETHLVSRREQLSAQTEAAVDDMKSKLNLFFSEQQRELSSKLENLLGKETNRLTTARHQAEELAKSAQLVSDRLDSLENGDLSVKDLVWLDRAQDDLKKQDQAAERLRKDCFPTDIHFYPSSDTDKVLRGLTIGTLTMEVKSQPSGGARPRIQRYVSEPGSSADHVSLPAQRSSPDVFEGAPPPRRRSKQDRALSPPGAGASSLSSSPSTAEGPVSGEWDASFREQRRRSEGPSTLSSSTRRTTTAPDFGAVLIEESRRSRSTPRRARPWSEGSSSSSSSTLPRRRGAPIETAIDGGSEGERSSERGVRGAEKTTPSVGSRSGAENQAAGSGARPERTTTTFTATAAEPHQLAPHDDLNALDTDVTYVQPPTSGGLNNTTASAPLGAEREQAGTDSDSGSHSARRIVCVRHFLASHGSDVKNHPGLVGICAVGKDRVAVSDRWNKVVKLLDISGRVMDVLVIAGGAEPWDLALKKPGVLAVTYPKEQKIRLADVVDGGSRLHYRSHFMTRDGYASLATYDPATLIASVCPPFGSPKIHLIDYMGAVLRALDCSGVAYPRCVDICGGEEVCVSDWTHHNVKIFARDGPTPKHTYSGVPGVPDAQLKTPMGVAWNGRGHVFIVDGKTSKLHAVCAQSGTCSAIFSLPQVQGGELKLVTFVDASPELCRSERALVVTSTSGSVQVYDLCSSF